MTNKPGLSAGWIVQFFGTQLFVSLVGLWALSESDYPFDLYHVAAVVFVVTVIHLGAQLALPGLLERAE